MKPKILLVNPPIYDFAAHDFWLKPQGLLTVAGFIRNKADFKLFDYLDRMHPFAATQENLASDPWGRGKFYSQQIPKPAPLSKIPRHFRRFGLPRKMFADFLTQTSPCNFALIQTSMTYWYQGVQEVIEDLRTSWPNTKIILGGNYATVCNDHVQKSGADLVVKGNDLQPLWKYIETQPDPKQPPLWEAYDRLSTGILKLTDGCPFNCTYCSISKVYDKFKPRPLEHCLNQLMILYESGVKNIAFYDDALLFDADKVLIPFLDTVLKQNIKVNFHTPNALNARFITPELAKLMIKAGFKTFYIGFESISSKWQHQTGSKVSSDELANAVNHLTSAGAKPANIAAYQILGHPNIDIQQLEASMLFANNLGIRGTLSDFSPIPGTPDGEYCRKYVDIDEPLFHNKTAFPIILLGNDEVNRLKDLQRKLNKSLRL